jgi:predicted RNA-binding Zn-ribbon protein involved in translation (DUF1610 family)
MSDPRIRRRLYAIILVQVNVAAAVVIGLVPTLWLGYARWLILPILGGVVVVVISDFGRVQRFLLLTHLGLCAAVAAAYLFAPLLLAFSLITGLASLVRLVVIMGRARRDAKKQCNRCGYSLSGVPRESYALVCPECGQWHDWRDGVTSARSAGEKPKPEGVRETSPASALT